MSIKKDVKRLIFAASGLAVLVIAAVVLLHLPDAEAEDEENSTMITLTDIPVSDILSVKITNQHGSFDIETITPDSEYEIKGMNDVPVDTSSLKTGVSYLANVKATVLAEENSAELEKYGLQEPLAEAEVITADKSTIVLVGNPAPNDNTTYVRLKDSNDVYVVSTYYVSRTLRADYEFITTALTAEIEDASNPPTVSRITITRPNEEQVVINEAPVTPEGVPLKGVHRHEFEQPAGVGIDAVRGEPVVYGMYGLSALEAAWYGETDYEKYGLAEPACVVEMTGDDNYSLKIGNPVYEQTEEKRTLKGYYGIFSELPNVVFVFAENNLPWLNIDYEDIMTRLFLLPGIYIISDVTVETEEHELFLKSEGDESGAKFSVNGKEYANQDNFKYFYQYLISASAENIYDGEEIGDLAAQFTYKYRSDELSDDVVEFRRTADRKLIITVNGEPLYKIKENYITRLNQNIEALLNGKEIITDW